MYRRNWHTAALPPLLEPIVLLAFGVGLGGFLPKFDHLAEGIRLLLAGEPNPHLPAACGLFLLMILLLVPLDERLLRRRV
ncbi:MAG: hypothetical protein P9F19_00010 [Candidatus Contendobacter sp.]|nr:hypothetical protein [Candidatus Contendobacter sp.]